MANSDYANDAREPHDASWEWMRNTARKLAEVLPNGEYLELSGQTHDVSAEMLTPALAEFFNR